MRSRAPPWWRARRLPSALPEPAVSASSSPRTRSTARSPASSSRTQWTMELTQIRPPRWSPWGRTGSRRCPGSRRLRCQTPAAGCSFTWARPASTWLCASARRSSSLMRPTQRTAWWCSARARACCRSARRRRTSLASTARRSSTPSPTASARRAPSRGRTVRAPRRATSRRSSATLAPRPCPRPWTLLTTPRATWCNLTTSSSTSRTSTRSSSPSRNSGSPTTTTPDFWSPCSWAA
mmetsp:Transcript_73109/g.194224  ORF Transcript_73109/g.194224 Transcript_73109/m.194224 type:complete len:237 (+) Transcript_73109:337-1047(+)